jgi:hypothetical protein
LTLVPFESPACEKCRVVRRLSVDVRKRLRVNEKNQRRPQQSAGV